MTQQEIETKARELAERCALAVLETGRVQDLYPSAPLTTKSKYVETILRELNLVALLEDKAILNKATNLQCDIKWMPFSSKWSVEGTLPDLWSADLRTAITNAMKETSTEKEREK